MSGSSSSILSAEASAFVPSSSSSSFRTLKKEEDRHNESNAFVKQKKTKEMRGPRKRHRKKAQGDLSSVGTSAYSQYDGVEDDIISYLSLEASDSIEYNNLDYVDSHSYVNNTDNGNYSYNTRYKTNPIIKLDKKTQSIYNNSNQTDYHNRDFSMDEFDTDDVTPVASECKPLPEEWSQWFDSIVDQFGRSSSPASEQSYSNLRSYPCKRSPSESSLDSNQWLDLQHEWTVSKQLLCVEDDLIAEELEREKWGAWAMHASEIERQRRCHVIATMDAAQGMFLF